VLAEAQEMVRFNLPDGGEHRVELGGYGRKAT
jgi:hypothetical protein